MGLLPDNVPNPALYRARWVLPIAGPAIEDGAVLVRGLSIDDVGPYGDVKKQCPANAIVDLGEAILFPGLINAHTHLENSAFKGKTPRGEGDMIAWIDAIFAAQSSIAEGEKASKRIAAWHSLPSLGTIAVADISHEPFSRENIGPEPLWGSVLYEVHGFDRERAEESMKTAAELQGAGAKTVSGVWLRFSITPHGTHSLHESVLRETIETNLRRGDLISIHLAESLEEVEFLKGGDARFQEALQRWGYWQDGWQPPGCSPVRYLHEMGLLGPEIMAVHCVHLDDDDIELMARSGATACLCPRSNAYIGVGQPRILDLMAAGIPLCLGTDGLGSADSLSLFDEMAFIRREYPEVPPEQLLRMASLNGARALRIDSFLGSFEQNKAGRFLAYWGDFGNDPYEALTSGIDKTKLEWVGGEIDLRP